ncbi:MAG: TraR/DksA C4-type zinc finger protein [Planctomycetes bacterium]|nr:TraR/DksA C4-type zinc finger protein [Planctomycetota bacterium]
MEGYRQLLLEKWAELLGDVNHIEEEALRKSRLDAAGDLSSMPIHMADMGTDNFEQEFALGLMDSERKILIEIRAALQRIDEGTFGICEGTGKPIAKARLNAKPWARYCIDYAKMVEEGLVSEGEKIPAEEQEDETQEYDD